VVEELPAGEYNLSITAVRRTADGNQEDSRLSNQRVTVGESAETPVTITIDLNQINRPNNQPNNQPKNQEDRR
jgi:hypothetical protein